MRPRRYAVPAVCALAAAAAGCALNTRQELDVGRQYAAQLDQQLPLVRDARIQDDLDAIAARLTPFSQRPEIRYRFFLVNSGEINAFAVPGGYVYVTRAIVERATRMDQLAGILGHEIGHVERRHSARQMGRAQAAQAGVGLASILLGDRAAGAAVTQTAALGATLALARYSRDQERDADRQAIRLTTAAGINPAGLSDFFAILRSVEGRAPDELTYFFASHPLTEERIAAVAAGIQRDSAAVRATRTGARDDPAFERLRAAVRRLPPPPKTGP